MKNVHASRRELIAAWFSGKYASGRTTNMLFEGDSIYSYGKHFCIARRLSVGGSYAMTTRKYSPSTRQQIALVRRVIPENRIVYCNDPDAGLIINQSVVEREVNALLGDALHQPKIREKTRCALEEQARHVARQFNHYRMAYIHEHDKAKTMLPRVLPCFNLELINRDMWFADQNLHQG